MGGQDPVVHRRQIGRHEVLALAAPAVTRVSINAPKVTCTRVQAKAGALVQPGDLSRLPAGSNTASRMRGSYERAHTISTERCGYGSHRSTGFRRRPAAERRRHDTRSDRGSSRSPW
jgi:hypothetical protein